ncbi:MAG: hypothetical protein GDA45_01900 [Chromatiales bacterium]|nr:hypothetical protein [Chromatiales bacterium]
MKLLYTLSRVNKPFFGSLLFLAFIYSSFAIAEEHSAHSLSANVTLTSEYLYRGVTQTNEDPALQGGFDYAHESGFYLGIWASSLEFNGETSDTPSLEIDVYGGISGEFNNGIGWDIGALYYIYPDQNEDVEGDYDFLEFYGGLSYEWDHEYSPSANIGLAYSTDYYGEDGDSYYIHGGFGMSLMGMIDPYVNVGYLDVDGDKSTPGYDYSHYAIGASKTFDILTFDLSWNDSIDSDDCADNSVCDAVVFSVSSSF